MTNNDWNKDLRLAMRQYGAQHYPEEACGLIIEVGKKVNIIDLPNCAEDRRNNFRIAPEEYAKASDLGEVIGVWHTHCDLSEKPSQADLAACESSELPWYIISVKMNEVGFEFSDVFHFAPSGFQMDYIGRPYVFGVFDCYSLVRDYYAREFQITLGNYPRIDNWFRLGHNFFVDHYKEEGFECLVNGEEPIEGDIFLINSSGDVPNHLAIYIGDEKIIHHTHGRLSRRDVYGGYWKKHTVNHLRHTSKCSQL